MKWQKVYPKITKSLLENPNIFTFYNFPASIRRSIYSTKLIESFNKQIKKYKKRKEQFPNEETLERFLVSLFSTNITNVSQLVATEDSIKHVPN